MNREVCEHGVNPPEKCRDCRTVTIHASDVEYILPILEGHLDAWMSEVGDAYPGDYPELRTVISRLRAALAGGKNTAPPGREEGKGK